MRLGFFGSNKGEKEYLGEKTDSERIHAQADAVVIWSPALHCNQEAETLGTPLIDYTASSVTKK